jgi:hypothetical protein
MHKSDASQVPVQESIVRWVGDNTNGHGQSTVVMHLSCVLRMMISIGIAVYLVLSLNLYVSQGRN